MENLIPPIPKKEIVTDITFCDCCSSYQPTEEVFEYECCYKFCLDCAVNDKLRVVNDIAATFGDEPINFPEINDFIKAKIKSVRLFM